MHMHRVPDLFLFDVRLPKMSGHELTHHITKQPALRRESRRVVWRRGGAIRYVMGATGERTLSLPQAIYAHGSGTNGSGTGGAGAFTHDGEQREQD